MKPLRDNPIEEGIDALKKNKDSKKKSKNSKKKSEITNRIIWTDIMIC